jgi:hypothetical protein
VKFQEFKASLDNRQIRVKEAENCALLSVIGLFHWRFPEYEATQWVRGIRHDLACP